MTERRMTQDAPWPEALADVVSRVRYRDGWQVRLVADMARDLDRSDGEPYRVIGRGTTLVITTETHDTYDESRLLAVQHLFIVPAATYNTPAWVRWLFDCYAAVELHECMEFFRLDTREHGDEDVDIVRPFAPTHGPGDNPYVVHDYATDVQRRTTFRGEVR